MLKDNTTAIILAAGLGTRMKSDRAKVLHEILGRPMIVYLLDTLKEVGVADIVLVVGHQADHAVFVGPVPVEVHAVLRQVDAVFQDAARDAG